MSDHSLLMELFNDKTIVTPSIAGAKTNVDLFEPHDQNVKVRIVGMPSDVIVIKADLYTVPSKVFRGSKGECKRADYIIVSPTHKIMLFIEMKKNKSAGAVQQLRGAYCFMKYCTQIGRAFWGQRKFLDDYRTKFIVLTYEKIRKAPLRDHRVASKHDKPETPHRLSYQEQYEFRMISS